jgi:putative transposon-encoded protein
MERSEIMEKILYLGKRSVYNAGNSKNISIPKIVLKDLSKKENFKIKELDITEVEVYFNRREKEMILKF